MKNRNNYAVEGSGKNFTSINPANGEIVWEGKEFTKTDLDKAVKQARLAFPAWSKLTLDARMDYLNKFSQELQHSQHEIAEVISKEMGKPLWESKNEVQTMIFKVKISIEAYEDRCPETVRDLPFGRFITRHRPHGVVAVFGPYNFPGHIPQSHIIPALLAGNTIVFKPSELTPLTAEKIFHLWEKIGLPAGVINLVQGGRETGKLLSEHFDIDGIFFTGSYATGIKISQTLASQPSKILALELGGNNPLIVGHITNIPAAVYFAIQSAYLTSGQRCTCARRLILTNTDSSKKLLQMLKEKVQVLSVGPYDKIPEPFMGPVISEKQALQLLKSQDELKANGGVSLVDMKHLKAGTGLISAGLMDVTAIKNRKDEEIFGPFLQVIRVNDLDEAIAEANRTKYGLCAGLLSDLEEEYRRFYQEIQAGVVNWNSPLTGATSGAPFGGIKCSGNHRPSAYYAADYCAYPVASQEYSQLDLPAALTPGMENFS